MRNQQDRSQNRGQITFDRLFVLRFFIVAIGVLFIGRLFYLQVLKQSHYKSLAKSEQFKQLEIEPERGTIYMRNGSEPVALAINESRYTIVADPTFVKDARSTADKLAPILNVDKADLEQKLSRDTRYVVLAKRTSKENKQKIAELGLKGVAWKEERIRTYPQGVTGSTVLGFVNDEGEGQYGVEGSLNQMLSGTPGTIRAVTDVQGVPLVQNKDNVVKVPENGKDVILSIDQTMQRIMEEELKKGTEATKAKSASGIIMEADTGRVMAMASYPSYDPSQYAKVEDGNLFKNKVVSDPMEPGSIEKLLTMSTAFDVGVVSPSTTYYDEQFQDIDGSIIKNVARLPAGERNMYDVLRYSLNTGAIYLVKQMGGGDINAKARSTLYTYLTDRFLLNQPTKIEQEEATIGRIQDPNNGDGLRVQYANMAFGQGLSVTLQQMASATSAIVNGGTYYKPTVVFGTKDDDGTLKEQAPEVLKSNVISSKTSAEMVDLMLQYSDTLFSEIKRPGFILGGKTGTAQVPQLNGAGYREDVYNGTFSGFIGRTKPKYVMLIRMDEGPVEESFGGFYSARPVFSAIASGIMDNIPFSE